ncbi:hypothetical protein OG705_19560 [Streptomyces sp. NBC_00838]|uniref:hypothetical protein n=1 Tax=Streptomyces sp. NBC_00838 TaxID=2903680 RepID=UPI0038662409|nr:hypothetical protein OG705_19560 [Streptomyces sp. NBC_00838]
MTPEPLAAATLFRAVMTDANWRCQCAGTCGQTHSRTEGRCPRYHGGRAPLMAAPADPSTPDRVAVTLPAKALRAWCPTCFTTAQRRTAQSRAPGADQPGLFDL